MLDLVSEYAADETVFPSERWAVTFWLHAQLIFDELSRYFGDSLPSIIDRITEDAQKPNQERSFLQERLATATQQEIANQLKTNGVKTHITHYFSDNFANPILAGTVGLVQAKT